MSHYNRRHPVLPPHSRPDSLDRSLPFKNNEARLKLIYEGQQLFKERPRQPSFKKQSNRAAPPVPVRRNEDPQTDPKYRSNIHHLQLREIKVSNRYKEQERDQRAESFQLPMGDTERVRPRAAKEGPLTTRNNREEVSVERPEMFKIKRKSISGSLKKKLKEAQTHHLSSVNPTVPLELNYFEEGKRVYKEGKVGEALRLFELAVERSPDLADGYYHCALCHLSKRNYQRSYDFLTLLVQKFPAFDRKTVPLFTAIAANHLSLPDKALSALTSGVTRYPDFLDLYVYRAKVSEGQGQLDDAQEDYEFVLKTKRDSPEVLLGYALLLQRKGLTTNALSALGSALYSDKGDLRGKILLARVRMNYSLGRLDECKKDLPRLCELQAENSEVEYYRGLLQMADRSKKQALLAFEKCIRANNHPDSVAGALVEITKSKIEDRDFYSALYHINRASFLKLGTAEIEKFRLFTEGVVFMMKRKINEGVDNFYRLAQRYSPIGAYFDRLFYLYRAFGHFMQNRHQLAIEDYLAAEKFTPKDKHVKYNQLIAEGIVAIQQGSFDQALATFDQAQATISVGSPLLKIEPFIYRAMTFIEKVRSAQGRGGQDELETLQQLFRALKELDKAYDVNDSNSNMLYLRSLIYMYLGKCQDGLQDIIKAISKSQENVAKYFFYRALAHQTLGNKKQALNDFNICINLDEKYANAYLERAKLLFSTEQAPKALEDLRRLKELDPTADTKLHEFCLYYLYREYDLAQLCLEEVAATQRRDELEVLLDLKQLRITNARDKMASVADRTICEVILGHWSVEEAPADDLHFFTRVEYYCYLGIRSYHQQQFDEAINNFTLALKEKSLQDLEEGAGGEREREGEGEEGVGQQGDGEAALESETKANELHYLNYNLFLSYLANQEHQKAYETFIRDVLPAKEAFLRSEQVSHLSKILFQAVKAGEQSPLRQEETLQVVFFRSLFGESVDFVEISLPGCILRTKLCYLMPFSRAIDREYSPRLNPDFILSCLRISEVENRPQPPWVRRNNQDLVFTDEVIDIDVEFQTTEHDEDAEEEYEDGEQGDGEQGEGEDDEEESREEVAFDPRRFRDQMRLDDDIERKLQKIMQRKKKTE